MASSHVQTINVDNSASVASQAFAALTITNSSDILVVCFRLGSTSITAPTIADTLSLSWTNLYNVADGNGDQVLIWWASTGSHGGSNTTVTVSWSSVATSARGFLSEYTGTLTSSVSDVATTIKSATTVATITSNSGVPAQSGEMLIAHMDWQSTGSSALTAGLLGAAGGSNGTIPANGTHTRGGIMFNHITTTSSVTGTMTWTTNNNAAIIVFSLKDSGATPSRGLFMQNPMNGLGTGGSYFANPIG